MGELKETKLNNELKDKLEGDNRILFYTNQNIIKQTLSQYRWVYQLLVCWLVVIL